MKLLIVLLGYLTLSLAADLTDEQKSTIRANAMLCTQQEGNTKEQAFALRNGNFEDADDKVKCYANCFLEKAGFIVDGQINGEAVLQKLAPAAGVDQVKAALATCDSVRGANKCETGFQIYQCFYKNRAWA
ncbi:general odorant-binding protein 56d-like [Drosophila hydei]|uniref:General odorant-binding protein 56d-like n=1 Tax=Drosophila hydei TaxID=7224 RepID=A0A6J1LBD2_DROHY|nr:general odorant-binding protein 56d-like [Drosophila hydei]